MPSVTAFWANVVGSFTLRFANLAGRRFKRVQGTVIGRNERIVQPFTTGAARAPGLQPARLVDAYLVAGSAVPGAQHVSRLKKSLPSWAKRPFPQSDSIEVKDKTLASGSPAAIASAPCALIQA